MGLTIKIDAIESGKGSPTKVDYSILHSAETIGAGRIVHDNGQITQSSYDCWPDSLMPLGKRAADYAQSLAERDWRGFVNAALLPVEDGD